MRNGITRKINSFCLILFSIFAISCQSKFQDRAECQKYASEEYLAETVDSSLIREAFEYQEILLERFGESSVKGLNHEAYHLQFYSSHGYGKSVKFEKKVGSYSISVKYKSKKEWFEDCKEYRIRIDEEEWNELEKMIYEFDFWTVEDFRVTKDVLDGYAFLLEGNRPKAEKCNKKSYKLVGRGSPRYDKMEALCENILMHESQIKFRYEQLNKMK
jgi:hypothetical protein